MAPARRRTVRSVLVWVLLALAGGGPAPRAAYAEVSAAAQAVRLFVAPRVVAAPASEVVVAPRLVLASIAPTARPQVVAGRLYLSYCSLLL